MFEVVNNDDLHVALKVYEQDFQKVNVGQKITFKLNSVDIIHKGEIFAISPVFEESNKTVHIHSHIIGGKEHLISGMYVQGEVVIAETSFISTLPEEAIVIEGNRSYVFIKSERS